MGDHVLFFYGTLMVPQILHKVIHGQENPEPWQKAMLHFQPAILHGYRRHRVQNADYPGIVEVPETATETEKLSAPEISAGTSVIGTLVSGLTDGDVHRLDRFEGSEYEKKPVVVRTLQEARIILLRGGTAESQLREMLNATGAEVTDKGKEEVSAVTYVWTAGKDMLEDTEWDFESFKRDKMAWWVGVGANESEW
ncbi:Disease resistance protein Aig2 [Penicillium hordei]|uniref:Putative gamma-glutamylcyclotransferase n=1 Tax=Penicillium hordei TaxID=40994 RepID=A0AAD6H378_9EURO|nr:Disease resistance protein Aig2 [Penicillium hordei]KAJ5602532.1 Disease resistance protein Aig2 [Penicillium hordei]